MPQQQQSITVAGLDTATILAISYSAFKQLNWEVLFAGDEKLLGATPKSWKTNSQQIIATGAEGLLTVSSEMIQNESFDLGGRNKKNIAAFLTAFENCKITVTETSLQQNLAAINDLRVKTQQVAEQEVKAAEEIDAAMNLSTSNLYVTYAIIAINVLVFILMVVDGAGIMDLNPMVHAKWGSNYLPLTLSGDWWRVISSTFIHFGIIHLLMNMYCLYMIGIYLEPMLGKVKYITAYLCTGVLASIISLWWHSDIAEYNSAGASGAIFGMYGLFLALLTTNLIPKQMRQPLLQSTGIFVVYNLVYGMKGGVDNAAHIGGLISGFVIGYIYVFAIKKEKEEQKLQWIIPLVIALTVGTAYGYLEQNKIGIENRNKGLTKVKEETYKDFDKFNTNYNEFVELQDKAITAVYDTTVKGDVYIRQLDETALPQWEKGIALANEMKTMDVNEAMQKKAVNIITYIQLRKDEIAIRKEMVTDKSDAVIIRLNEVIDKINAIVDTLR
jgi:rhomboid protease GluP